MTEVLNVEKMGVAQFIGLIEKNDARLLDPSFCKRVASRTFNTLSQLRRDHYLYPTARKVLEHFAKNGDISAKAIATTGLHEFPPPVSKHAYTERI